MSVLATDSDSTLPVASPTVPVNDIAEGLILPECCQAVGPC
jgi:hypothetical protein